MPSGNSCAGFRHWPKGAGSADVAIVAADSDFRQKGGGWRARKCGARWGSRSSTTAAIRPIRSTSPQLCAASRRSNPDFVYIVLLPDRNSRRASRGRRTKRPENQVVRRRHGRDAIRGHQGPTRRVAQPDRRLRFLCPGADGTVQRHRKLPCSVPGRGAFDRRGPAGYFTPPFAYANGQVLGHGDEPTAISIRRSSGTTSGPTASIPS